MPKQTFSVLDYCGPLLVGATFASIVFVLSLAMNWLFIRQRDEITSFEKDKIFRAAHGMSMQSGNNVRH
ncbi:unnamed protein product [Nippostrongylus brasiliensis]|uniref:Col_cuticle_N domain-containing protein n=1 Tax=Nippostrongylus brasiliensis TaxID=27835 RepID=A0A0N4XYH5_NIPBR|nr:unnamed protein product [Nippostrongylus brasiliensis]